VTEKTDTPEWSLTGSVLGLTLVGYFATYGGNIFLSRVCGVVAYGDYSAAISIATIGYTIALLGKDKLALKTLPLYFARGALAEAKGFVTRNVQVIAVSGIAVIAVWEINVALHRYSTSQMYHHPALLAVYFIPFMAVVDFFSKIFIAADRVISAVVVYKVLLPVVLVLAAYVVLRGKGGLSGDDAVLAAFAGWLSVLVILGVAFHRTIWARLGGRAPQYRTREWTREGIPYLVNGLVLTALQSVGVILLEALHEREDVVGIFAAVNHTTSFQFILFTALSPLFLPRLAPAVEARNVAAMNAVLRVPSRVYLGATLVCAVLFVGWGREILDLFGPEFREGYPALLVMSAGASVSMLVGMSTPALQFAGQHRLVIVSYLLALLGTVVLNVLLVPGHHLMGAAMGATVPRLLLFGSQAYFARARLGLSLLPR
jgi:O-antigen/teichoic acid export membrane protein